MSTIQDRLRHGYPSKERIEAADRIDLLENALQAANATIEEYERKYYLTLDQRDAAVEALTKDAERYRWLRDDAYSYFWSDYAGLYPRTGLDKSIDAEINVQKDQ